MKSLVCIELYACKELKPKHCIMLVEHYEDIYHILLLKLYLGTKSFFSKDTFTNLV